MLRQLVLILALLPLATVPAAADGAGFEEDWSDGRAGWIGLGLGMDVACEDACHLRVEPPCCEATMSLERAADIPLSGMIAFDIAFRADSLLGDTDTYIGFSTDLGSYVNLHTTEWFNNGLSLQTDQDMHRDFGQNPAAGEWRALRIVIDGDGHAAQGQLLDGDGQVVDASRILQFGAGTRIRAVTIAGTSWQETTTGFDYGALSLGPTNASFAMPSCPVDAYAEATPDHSAQRAVKFRLHPSSECGAYSWRLEFGDGRSMASDLPPPSTVTHAYPAAGAYVATFTVRSPSGEVATWTMSVEAFDYGIQDRRGTAGPSILGVDLVQDGFIVLDRLSDGRGIVELLWGSASDLDVLFYDEDGRLMAVTECEGISLGTTARCNVPVGAAFADVTGTAVQDEWFFSYTYPL